MASAAEDARAHLALAEKALKTSFFSMKFSPDYLTASMEYNQAATRFRAAGCPQDAMAASIKEASIKEQHLNDLHGAGRAYEAAGAIAESAAPESVAANWEQAARCYQISGRGETATKMLQKLATLHEKQGCVGEAKAALESAIAIFESEDKDYNLGDIYKAYIGLIIRTGDYEAALLIIDRYIEVLSRQRHFPFVHKEVLGKVLLLLKLGDTVRADEVVGHAGAVEGFFASKECEVGSELIEAFRSGDAEAVERLLKDQTISFLHIEIARMARSLRAPAAPAVAAAQGVADGDAQPQSLGELLM